MTASSDFHEVTITLQSVWLFARDKNKIRLVNNNRRFVYHLIQNNDFGIPILCFNAAVIVFCTAIAFASALSMARDGLQQSNLSRRDFHGGSMKSIAASFVSSMTFQSSAFAWGHTGSVSADSSVQSSYDTSKTTALSMTAQSPTSPTPRTNNDVAYKTISLEIPRFSAQIPVACWFPTTESGASSKPIPEPTYKHRISVRRIGELLAGWEFIPSFASRSFNFRPTATAGSIVSGEYLPFPQDSKVVILSHGFLGSRFDLSHIAEELASRGFVCVSPEYPESLAASYQREQGLDRKIVNNVLLNFLETTVKPSGYGVVGHSLGCGTALSLGDSTWAKVLIAGPPPPANPESPMLLITSMNDVFVRSRAAEFDIPPMYERLRESQLPAVIPKRAVLLFDRPDGPNHISYLSESVNDAMVGFLSPFLPVAQALSIPVLDFDTYKVARDAEATAKIIKPLIADFLVQQLPLEKTIHEF